jgi:hypothetical protein
MQNATDVAKLTDSLSTLARQIGFIYRATNWRLIPKYKPGNHDSFILAVNEIFDQNSEEMVRQSKEGYVDTRWTVTLDEVKDVLTRDDSNRAATKPTSYPISTDSENNNKNVNAPSAPVLTPTNAK